MGHDITIVDEKGKIIAETSISGNFSDLSKDKIVTIDQFHGHNGRIISEMILHTFTTLTRLGYITATLDKKNINWEWGLKKDGNKMTKDDFIEVYMYHLHRFLKLAVKYPNNVWQSDQVWNIISVDELIKQNFLTEDSKKYMYDEKDNEEENELMNSVD